MTLPNWMVVCRAGISPEADARRPSAVPAEGAKLPFVPSLRSLRLCGELP